MTEIEWNLISQLVNLKQIKRTSDIPLQNKYRNVNHKSIQIEKAKMWENGSGIQTKREIEQWELKNACVDAIEWFES